MIVDDPVELLEAGDDGGGHLRRGRPAGHPDTTDMGWIRVKTKMPYFHFFENARCRENESILLNF